MLSSTSNLPIAVQPHQGHFVPLRGAQAGIFDLAGCRRAGPMAGTGRGTGLSGPNKEQGTWNEVHDASPMFLCLR